MTYKGFDKNMKCRGFQYEIGKDYTQKGENRLCRNGLRLRGAAGRNELLPAGGQPLLRS